MPASRASTRIVSKIDLSFNCLQKALTTNDCRFLSDTRPPHAFYVSGPPDTIHRTENACEQIAAFYLPVLKTEVPK
jgi:hypothetical protein